MKKFAKYLSEWGIFVGLIAGCLIGLVFHQLQNNSTYRPVIESLINNLFAPMGTLFLQSLFMIIVPLIFSSLTLGVAEMGDPKSVGRLSKRLFIFYACSTFIAIFIGQIFMTTLKPGFGFSENEVERITNSMEETMSSIRTKSSLVGTSLWPGILTTLVPRNIIDQFAEENILAVIFVSLLFGFSLLVYAQGSSKRVFYSGYIRNIQ